MAKNNEARYFITKWESYNDPSSPSVICQIGHRIVRRFKTKPDKCIAYFPMDQIGLARKILTRLKKDK